MYTNFVKRDGNQSKQSDLHQPETGIRLLSRPLKRNNGRECGACQKSADMG